MGTGIAVLERSDRGDDAFGLAGDEAGEDAASDLMPVAAAEEVEEGGLHPFIESLEILGQVDRLADDSRQAQLATGGEENVPLGDETFHGFVEFEDGREAVIDDKGSGLQRGYAKDAGKIRRGDDEGSLVDLGRESPTVLDDVDLAEITGVADAVAETAHLIVGLVGIAEDEVLRMLEDVEHEAQSAESDRAKADDGDGFVFDLASGGGEDALDRFHDRGGAGRVARGDRGQALGAFHPLRDLAGVVGGRRDHAGE